MKHSKSKSRAMGVDGINHSLAGLSVDAQSAEKTQFCVLIRLGSSGMIFNQMKDVKVQALSWGYDLDVRAYTDEAIAANDFRAGRCDAAFLTDVRARDFNKFTATLVCSGAIPTDDALKTLLGTLVQEKAGPLMSSGDYEVAGILPAGGVYVFTRDKAIHSVEAYKARR